MNEHEPTRQMVQQETRRRLGDPTADVDYITDEMVSRDVMRMTPRAELRRRTR